MLTTPPLSLYIHFPWCIRKCPYCDFNSHTLKTDLPETDYINALITDLENDLDSVEERELVSIFMGGGTPSLFSATSIDYLLSTINKKINFANTIEITLEANPGTVEFQRFADYRSAGINRLSIGIQSFQDDKLKSLGRIHGANEAKRAAETAHQAGFTNFNLDLMHGLPQQTVADGLYDLNTALSFSPSHLSWYQLTLEPNTLFAHQPPSLPDDELIWELQDQGRDLLAQYDFHQYEISAYSLPDKQCIHNLNYWQFGDYLGIGAGAHSKITDSKQKTITRIWKLKNPKDYLNKNNYFIGEKKLIHSNEIPFEFMLNTLRLYQDISIELLQQRTGLNLKDMIIYLEQAKSKKLLHWDNDKIYITELGRRFYNDLVEIFINS